MPYEHSRLEPVPLEPSTLDPKPHETRAAEETARVVGRKLGTVAHAAEEAKVEAEKRWVETRRFFRDLKSAQGRGRHVGALIIAGAAAGFVLGVTLGTLRD